MRKARLALSLLLLLTICVSFKSYRKNKIIFFGDSITELGVKQGGYIDLIKQDAQFANWEVLGKGVSGNKVYDLYLRLKEDVLAQKPTHVVIYVGVNDVWHKSLLGTGTDYDKFIQFYQALIDQIKAAGAEVILVSPAVVGELKGGANPLDADLDKYADAIRKLAEINSTKICDLRKIFVTFIEDNNPLNEAKNILTYDGVHLNARGNRIVADQLIALIK